MNKCKVTKAQAILDQASYGSLDTYQINMMADLINALSDEADEADLLRDEIARIRVANHYNYQDGEIDELCDRVLSGKVVRRECIANEVEALKRKLEHHQSVVTADKLIHVLFYAPKSPLNPNEAAKLKDWFLDNKEAISALRYDSEKNIDRIKHPTIN